MPVVPPGVWLVNLAKELIPFVNFLSSGESHIPSVRPNSSGQRLGKITEPALTRCSLWGRRDRDGEEATFKRWKCRNRLKAAMIARDSRVAQSRVWFRFREVCPQGALVCLRGTATGVLLQLCFKTKQKRKSNWSRTYINEVTKS